jgi:rfaE bifunctional protein nucleotidyltransferase chain/domain
MASQTDARFELEYFLKLLPDYRQSNKKIVFTNGVFDILHRGHVEYLTKAKALGDLLVVGVNSDASARRIKGENRPIVPEADRAFLVSMLEPVDHVILFPEDTPAMLIEKIRPDVLVKGADYQVHEIVGHDIVLGYGGRVERIALTPGRATTDLIGEILERFGGQR